MLHVVAPAAYGGAESVVVELGDNVLLGPGVGIWCVNHVFVRTDQAIIELGYDHRKVVIGNGVWIGAHSFLNLGANIGEGVVVSAGSVVGGKDVEPYAIVASNPARRLGSRRDRIRGKLIAGAPPDGGRSGP